MTYAMVLIEKPDENHLWPTALATIENKEPPEGATKLPGHSWLIHLESGLDFFGTLQRHIASNGLRHAVAFFAEKPEFILKVPA